MSIKTCQCEVCECGYRILVIDNHSQWRDDYVELLKEWGYVVYTAEGLGKALLEDARNKAHMYRCHIAIVDKRLLADKNRGDYSGLELVPGLQPTRSIVVTSYIDGRTSRELSEKGAYSIVVKQEGPEELQKAIDQALHDSCRKYILIQWPYRYEPSNIVRKLALEPFELTQDQPQLALCRLYSANTHHTQVEQIELSILGGPYRSANIVSSPARSSVLIAHPKGRDGLWHQPEIIKIASRQQITNEIDAYQKYVRRLLDPQRSARIEDSRDQVVLWDIGVIRYTNVSTNPRKTLQEWFEDTNTSTDWLRSVIKDLFKVTLKPWYNLDKAQLPNNLVDEYISKFEKLQRIYTFPDQNEEIALPGLQFRVKNPVAWVQRHRAQSRFISFWHEITHGDLHSTNVFVSPNAETCVIGFERTGPGHILRDFVELEADILLRLSLFTKDNWNVALKMAALLLAPQSIKQLPIWQEFETDDEKLRLSVKKAFDVITELRQTAVDISRIKNWDEYYWALLMESLLSVLRNYSDWEDQKKAEQVKDWAVLWCSTICERLSRWDEAWPPPNWGLPSSLKKIVPTPLSILYLAANPNDMTQLQLEEEMRSLENVLVKAKVHERFKIEPKWATRRDELQEHFLDHAPTIVHFSGHGSASGEIFLKSSVGESAPVAIDALAKLFSIVKKNIRCIILNACYVANQAEAIAEHIDVVVGTTSDILDKAAIEFAAGFYRGLARHKSIQECFDLGCNAIELAKLPGHDLPRLLCLRHDPSSLYIS